MEQRKLIFDHIIDIRDEPARFGLSCPEPAGLDPGVTLLDSMFFKHSGRDGLAISIQHGLSLKNYQSIL